MRAPIGRVFLRLLLRLLLITLFGFPRLSLAFTPTLYDQNNNCDIHGTNSQLYDPVASQYTDLLADDLIVPAAELGWSVTVVSANGRYTVGEGPVETVNVIFYRDASGLPGAEVAGCHYTGLTTYVDSAGALFVTLPTPCTLRDVGDVNTKYWVAVQAQMPLEAFSWFWLNRSVTSNSPAAWMNPGNGSKTGCTTWSRRAADCGLEVASPDQCFTILGFYSLFSNGFESGNTSLWSDTIPHP
jgi:hypothetical protein